MRTMYDSVTPSAIPTNAQLVAGYVDGAYAWSDAGWGRFPHAVRVRIAVRASTDDGHVLDVEQGDATPAQATGWVAMRRSAGADPSVYCNEGTWPAVVAAFHAAGVAEPHYWIAHYDGSTAVPDGAVAKQYNDPPGSGGNYDISAVADYWPGVDATKEPDMQLTDPLNPNPAPGTVNEALNAVLYGVSGVRAAGPLAATTFATLTAVNALGKQTAAIQGALPQFEADLLGAIQTGQQHVNVELSADQLATITAPITAALATLPAAVKLAIGQALIGGTTS